MALRGTLIVALLSLVFAGCGEDEPVSAPAGLSGPVEYARSGGIAGVVEKLTVQPDGSAVAATLDAEKAFKLSADEQARLARAVDEADLPDAESPDKRMAADALEYSVSYGGNQVVWSDVTDNPDDDVVALYELLAELYTANAPG